MSPHAIRELVQVEAVEVSYRADVGLAARHLPFGPPFRMQALPIGKLKVIIREVMRRQPAQG